MIGRSAAFVALLALAAAPAAASPPELARVAGLPKGDTLTLRERPSASAPAIGALREGDGPVEILETRRNGATEWARIGLAEGQGWAARRFLQSLELEKIGETSLTVGLACGGTEPFWSVALTDAEAAHWMDPETGATRPVAIKEAIGASGRPGWPAAVALAGQGFNGVLLARPGKCSDGMSDRDYPWTAQLLDLTGQSMRLFEGCCGHPTPGGGR